MTQSPTPNITLIVLVSSAQVARLPRDVRIEIAVIATK